ncbi:MAG TPA: hypothetical protein DCE55_27190 [Planctomycetaceae bacterium]|nr:hypothetical protein [Planctomycetaceae bacterium]|tara:strand:+ start:1962 stop:4328 length:2367 start_codon:yes stop_codon:yes gene_type:complete
MPVNLISTAEKQAAHRRFGTSNPKPLARYVGLLPAALLSCLLPAVLRAERPDRFVAMRTDGKRFSGNTLGDWKQGPPTLDGHDVFNAEPTLSWLLDRQAFRQPPATSFIESVTGERLPGAVLGYRSSTGHQETQPAPHFLVRAAENAALPGDGAPPPPVRFAVSWARRIVWDSRQPEEYQPGNVFFRDGRRLRFRAVRWSDQAVRLLTPTGTTRVAWKDLRELHFPQRDVWESYLDELATLAVSSQSQLIQLETTQGLLMTGTRKSLLTRPATNPPSARWLVGLQPAWSLDPVWVAAETVLVWRQFQASQVPLHRIHPSHTISRLSLGGAGPRWQTNRNVQGGNLRSGGLDYGWGFGVHAFSELGFPLPPMRCVFRTAVGLDQISGPGGCIQARIRLGKASTASYETPPLVGSTDVRQSGAINCDPANQHLFLEVDPLISSRPAGADPLEIRDTTNWLEPRLQLSTTPLERQLRQRYPRQIKAWQGWDVVKETANGIRYEQVWTDVASPPGRFLTGVVATEQPFALTAEKKQTAPVRWLVVGASRPATSESPPQLEIHVDGQHVTTAPVPLRAERQQTLSPIAVRLQPLSGKSANRRFEIRQLPSTDRVPVIWHSIRLVDQLPTRYEWLDEPAATVPADPPLPWTSEDHYTGAHAVQVTSAATVELTLSHPLPIRQFPQWGEYRFLRFALKASSPGRVFLEMRTTAEGTPLVGYLAGPSEPIPAPFRQVWKEPLPDRWLVITRDLFRDFGTCHLSRLTLRVAEGGPVSIDHIYLSSRTADLQPATPPK